MKEVLWQSLELARIFRSLRVQGAVILGADAHPQRQWAPKLDWHLSQVTPFFVLLEGEGDGRAETRLTVNWDEGKIRLGFNR